jgi:hypothetical protein
MTYKEFCMFDIYENKREFGDYVFEGIDVDVENRVVTFNDNHEENVDTSIENNPTYKTISGVETIMLFKRKKSNEFRVSDGNPLVYALKSIKSWKISTEDRNAIFDRIDDIITKIGVFDTIVVMPSSNPLVKELGNHLMNNNKAKNIINHCVVKRLKSDIIDDMPWSGFSNKQMTKIEDGFSKMGDYFESKFFPKDKKIIDKFETNIFKINKNKDYNTMYNKNVLVIDDTISTGLSLNKCSQIINEQYNPKSIKQLSLFSDL